jgi:hypothetical protein
VLRPAVQVPTDVSASSIVSRPTHTRRTEASSASLARWGGAAACLGGISYGAAGYLDAPDTAGFVIGVVLPVLEVVTPALFLGGFLGLYFWPGGGGPCGGSVCRWDWSVRCWACWMDWTGENLIGGSCCSSP